MIVRVDQKSTKNKKWMLFEKLRQFYVPKKVNTKNMEVNKLVSIFPLSFVYSSSDSFSPSKLSKSLIFFITFCFAWFTFPNTFNSNLPIKTFQIFF